jgi:hypothetical protein
VLSECTRTAQSRSGLQILIGHFYVEG